MSKITIYNVETGETIKRDMNADELFQMQQDIKVAVLPEPTPLLEVSDAS